MMPYLFPLITVFIGMLIMVFFPIQNKKNIKLLLSFSGAFLLGMTVLHLLPKVFDAQNSDLHFVGIFILIGIVIQIVLEHFSKGAEHGHVHTNGHGELPILLFISLCFHAFLEGFAVAKDPQLAIGIGIHHFPVAIILTPFLVHQKKSKWHVGTYMFLFAIMTPLGTLLAQQFEVLWQYQNQCAAVVIGVLFHISSTIIFETNEAHTFNRVKLTAILLGFALSYLI